MSPEVTAVTDAIERLETLLDRRPGFGQDTDTSVTTLHEGLRCSSEERRWHIDTDMPKGMGGSASAPTPGVLLRASLGACLAMMYQMRGARHGVEFTSIRVTLEADSQVSGMLLLDAPARPGYTDIRYHVEVESPATRADVQRVLDEGDQLSPLLDALANATRVSRTTSIKERELT